MADTLSRRTKSSIASVLIAPENDYYPDRALSDRSVTTGTPIPRLPRDIVPTTSDDMSNLYQWKPGDAEPAGKFAKDSPGMKAYRNDMDNAPDPADYKPLYIDTTKPLEDQLNRWRK